MGKEVKGKLPEGLYFSENMAYREPRLETWVRQRGKALYTADGKLGYDLEDLDDYFAFWFQMQEDGLTPPADLQSQAIADPARWKTRCSSPGTRCSTSSTPTSSWRSRSWCRTSSTSP